MAAAPALYVAAPMCYPGATVKNPRACYRTPGFAFLACTLAALAVAFSGCGALKGKDAPKDAAKAEDPADDRLRTKNDDTLYGRLEGDKFTLKSPLFQRLELPRAELREIQFEGDQDVVRTKRGDVIKGQLDLPAFRFKAKVGVTRDFRRADLKWIELGG